MGKEMEKQERNRRLDMTRVEEVVYWAKRWEISPNQLLIAVQATKSNRILKIRNWLISRGFAL
ncbi:MAG: hypothetical protein C5B59_06020 [Bacteroidetes bacterium]|nr:MAG: hypothetical protein C5B59_06020 [Bacteroidota bacterium]